MLSWLLLSSAFAVTSPSEVQDPRATEHWVTDQAGALPDEAEARLNGALHALYRDKGAEVAVVVLDRIDGDADAFASELFRIWGLGSRNRDRGALLLVATQTENLSVITGLGLMSDLPSAWTAQMQMDTLVPHLGAGDVAGALDAGVAALAERIQPLPRVPEQYTAAAAAPPPEQGLLDSIPLAVWAALAGAGVIGLILAGWRLLGTGDDEDLGGDLPPKT